MTDFCLIREASDRDKRDEELPSIEAVEYFLNGPVRRDTVREKTTD